MDGSVKHYANNPRQITRKEFEQLKTDLAGLGYLGGLVHDLNTDQLIGGNQRARIFDLSKIEPIILQEFDPPTAQGTVAIGYVEWQGERFAYRAVRWDEETARRANIRANMAGGAWDWDIRVLRSLPFNTMDCLVRRRNAFIQHKSR